MVGIVPRTRRSAPHRTQNIIGSTPPRAFTLTDVLVSITVIGVLMSLLLPALSMVRETTRKVVCSSNLRQVGLGLAMYADDFRDQLPPATSLNYSVQRAPNPNPVPIPPAPSQLMTLRNATVNGWDGLGRLYPAQYAGVAGVYYCPSHKGEHPNSRYAGLWSRPSGVLVGNYQYRVEAANARVPLRSFDAEDSLLTDGLRTRLDFNHLIGCNVLRADIAVVWYRDDSARVLNSLAVSSGPETAAMADEAISEAFRLIDNETVVTTNRGG